MANDRGVTKRYSLKADKSGRLSATEDETKSDRHTRIQWDALFLFSGVGFGIVIPLIAGVLLGNYADTRLGSRPVATITGLLIGTVLSVASLISTFSAFLKKTKTGD
ncbi:hypothetical protein A2Z33_04980 [Candidatus Gottesmanbacteria bacterium RBG_16_52_11]|uniref:AtpZ/AtpI family protein n=1 Tax=Candidatus Gottesmanbacteria bacterium RBG_16_52_11 TaxID=1798374 RepID=A0A1F5YQA4_9BACT|nr:MAG: hypothetical protein A2Z33_04980 [Candidatus Gottesmanbacteria bacterium RBG_16_52_11]